MTIHLILFSLKYWIKFSRTISLLGRLFYFRLFWALCIVCECWKVYIYKCFSNYWHLKISGIIWFKFSRLNLKVISLKTFVDISYSYVWLILKVQNSIGFNAKEMTTNKGITISPAQKSFLIKNGRCRIITGFVKAT